MTIYRIIQESLTNIAVHANAKHAVIELTESPGAATSAEHFVRVTIADDGAGFFQMSADRGFGLPGIRERVRALGGDCSIETEPGRGTRISVLLPRAVSAEA